MKKQILFLSLICLLGLSSCSDETSSSAQPNETSSSDKTSISESVDVLTIIKTKTEYYSYSCSTKISKDGTQYQNKYDRATVDLENVIEYQYGYSTKLTNFDGVTNQDNVSTSYTIFYTPYKKYELDTNTGKYTVSDLPVQRAIETYKSPFDYDKASVTVDSNTKFSGSVSDENISAFFNKDNLDMKSLTFTGAISASSYVSKVDFSYTTSTGYSVSLNFTFDISVTKLAVPE